MVSPLVKGSLNPVLPHPKRACLPQDGQRDDLIHIHDNEETLWRWVGTYSCAPRPFSHHHLTVSFVFSSSYDVCQSSGIGCGSAVGYKAVNLGLWWSL